MSREAFQRLPPPETLALQVARARARGQRRRRR